MTSVAPLIFMYIANCVTYGPSAKGILSSKLSFHPQHPKRQKITMCTKTRCGNDQVTRLGIFQNHVQSRQAIVSGLSHSNADGAVHEIPA